MKKALVIALMASFTVAFAVTPFPGPKGHKVFLKASKSPYLLENSVVLPATDSLIIEAGVEVFMSGYAKLLLRGSVQILGTSQKPVAFRNADSSDSWNGVHFATGSQYFVVRNLVIENAFRNTVTQSSGIFENVHFVNNYYGLWVENAPKVELVGCSFRRNRFALSVGTGSVHFKKTEIRDNVFGLYLEKGATFVGDTAPIHDNLEADVRRESDEMAGKGRKVSHSVWQRIEAGF
ncbi:MAG: right-handed parallel beta-helix repeat-containing protein [Fibrobacteraceae bacterium]